MEYNVFKKNVIKNLESYKINNLSCEDNGMFRGIKYTHILPKKDMDQNLLPLVEKINDIKYHMYAHHLNSSQMMCINFFYPFIKNEDKLIDLISTILNIKFDIKPKITKKQFEYTPDGSNHTNFDFFLQFSTGEKIYFEIKYTEIDFGKTSPDKKYPDRYDIEWNNFYKLQTEASKYLNMISKNDFYKNYQINRNIAYIKDDRDYVCFIYPFDNDNLSNEMTSVNFNNVFKIDWKDICNTAINIFKDTDYYNHFIEFKNKYLNY